MGRVRNNGRLTQNEHAEVGSNCRRDELQGVVLGMKLRYLDEWNARRRHYAERYRKSLAPYGIDMPQPLPTAEAVWHLFPIAVERRDDLATFLREHRVDTGIHYPVPLHLQPAFAALGYKQGDFPVADCNLAAVQWIDRWPDWPGPILVVSGPAGCGKTHLAHVWQERSGAAIRRAAALDAESVAKVREAKVREESIALVVEDERLMSELLVQRLTAHGEFEVCGTATNVTDAVRLAERTRPDLVVMDHRIGGGTGVEATRRIRALVPAARVVMLTAEASDDVIAAAIRAGAVGYVHKYAVVSQLLSALRAALRGEAVFPQSGLARIGEAGKQGGVAVETLSRREQDVLRMLAEGLDSKSMAQRLGVSYHTVREHAQRVIEKLGARSRLEAVAHARERGLL